MTAADVAAAAALLGVAEDADRSEVEAAYRRLVAEAHPDRLTDADDATVADANARTRALTDARRVLLGQLRSEPRPEPPEPLRPPGPVHHLRAPRTAAPPPPRPEPDDRAWELAIERRRRPGCLVALGGLAAAIVVCMVVLGVASPGRSDAADREVLGPTAARYWAAEHDGDYAQMWLLSEQSLRDAVPQVEFVAHLRVCPPRVPPRNVYRMAKRPDGLWEVEARTAGAYEPTGLQTFRREETPTGATTFGAVIDDPNLIEFLSRPLAQAAASPFCRRFG